MSTYDFEPDPADYDPEPAHIANPSKAPWVGLTDEWVESAGARWVRDGYDLYTYARAIEAKLKEKNT